MYSKILSGTLRGIEGVDVYIEADVSNGLPMFEMVGYLSSEVKESRERVRTALKNSGYSLPAKRITVNLSPADMHKSGTAFDLGIALSILSSTGEIVNENFDNMIILGELGLNGEVRSVNGILPMLFGAYERGVAQALIPLENIKEGSVVKGMKVYGVRNLKEAVDFINGELSLKPVEADIEAIFEEQGDYENDFECIVGQEFPKRALEIAAAGFHNILLIGPPGAGKSMMAKCLPSILPPLTLRESIELTKIYSVKGLLKQNQSLITKRAFRSPHHTLSSASLSGGGSNPVPGEMSLAHNSVLFLDELPEFKREALEVMRQPLEDKTVTISRVQGSYTFPADFMLVGAMNPCPCGYYPNRKKCNCSDSQIRKYLGRISQPMLDRMDMCVEAKAVGLDELVAGDKSEPSASIRERVINAHRIQKERYESLDICFNSQLSVSEIEQFCKIKTEDFKFLRKVIKQQGLSARAYHRILRVSRTIADLKGGQDISKDDLCEAIMFHNGNFKYWG